MATWKNGIEKSQFPRLLHKATALVVYVSLVLFPRPPSGLETKLTFRQAEDVFVWFHVPGGARRGPLFHEDEPFSSESEDTSGSPEASDSAVESSSEGSEGSSTSEEEESGGESSDEEKGDYNPFGAEGGEKCLLNFGIDTLSVSRVLSSFCRAMVEAE